MGVPCPYCDRVLADFQGRAGHIRFKHPERFKYEYGRDPNLPYYSRDESLDRLVEFAREVGDHRMETCAHLRRGKITGKLLCWYWRFSKGTKHLELIPIEGEGYSHAVASPEMCGICAKYEGRKQQGPAE